MEKQKNKALCAGVNKGFSLVELIIVIAIMAILAAAIAPALIRYIDKSRKATDVDAANTILEAAVYSYNEGYSYEGQENGVEQDADVQNSVTFTVSPSVGGVNEDAYTLECIATAQNSGNTAFTNGVDAHIHFLNLVRTTLSQNNPNIGNFCKPKFRKNVGNGSADGFMIGRRHNAAGISEGFEIWVVDNGGNPIYRLAPTCCDEYR